jgi:hypothetical protein
MGKKGLDLALAHVVRMPLVMEEDEAPAPIYIGLVSSNAVTQSSDFLPDLIQ